MAKSNVVAIIPARGGSKGVPGKNIRPLAGFPLIAYSILASKLCTKVERTIVSTDSEEIADIAKSYGAEVPFMRPKEFARDTSGDMEFVLHAIRWFKENESHVPEYFVHLRPTTPLRSPVLIGDAVDMILKDAQATALRSLHELGEAPEKMFRIDRQGYLTGIFPNDPRPEYYNLPRQSFPSAYHPNGYVDIIRTGYVIDNNKLHGPKILGFVTPKVTEIDTADDFDYLEYEIKKRPSPLMEGLIAAYDERNR